jgi:hypothetical protein
MSVGLVKEAAGMTLLLLLLQVGCVGCYEHADVC